MKTILTILLGSLPATLLTPMTSADDLDRQLDAEEQAQTATAITVIFDNSGSMRERDKLGQAKRAFLSWLAGLPESYRIGLIHFNLGVGKLAVPIGEGNREAVMKTVKGLDGYGKTPICDCLRLASEQIAKRRVEHSPYERHVVVVFTDGAETVDRRLNKGVVQDVMKLQLQTIEVVGIGFHGEGDYMSSAATRYFQANNEAELKRGLSKVDAEIDANSPLEVTDADIKLMQSLDIPAPRAPSS